MKEKGYFSNFICTVHFGVDSQTLANEVRGKQALMGNVVACFYVEGEARKSCLYLLYLTVNTPE